MFRVLNHSGQKHLPGISLWISNVAFACFKDDEDLFRLPQDAAYKFFRYVFGGRSTDFDLEVAVRVWRV